MTWDHFSLRAINLRDCSSKEEYLRLACIQEEPVSTQCCAVPQNVLSSLVVREGYLVCDICGLVKERYLNNEYIPETIFTSSTGLNPGFHYQVKRFYKPLNHFREHLRRYMGSRHSSMDLALLTFDPKDRDAFHTIKSQLKQLKLVQEYKNIWSIIYALGGKKPDLSNEQFHTILRYFYKFIHNFTKLKTQRKSVPSHEMILHQIFLLIDYEPFYHLPIVQSISIRAEIEIILTQCLG